MLVALFFCIISGGPVAGAKWIGREWPQPRGGPPSTTRKYKVHSVVPSAHQKKDLFFKLKLLLNFKDR